ncbi:YveK family protein [Weissella halotolerans]|uniref:Capsular polysaccharide biosynthesis protein CpsC n=1 Tax=Weissella halotolerans DSM 20190 TaxID=1123500 RepID=A0A0R2G2T7_9LACO|nr:Wzz/FepE/Etk N-terminal domain-containing protein [Weissella halotolerans]KRN31277.1 hypothetical protein IV68_GL001160 [Weissella halotolerans DSM 20190]
MDNVIDLNRLWLILKKNALLMIILGIVFGAIGFGISKFVIQPKYSSSVSLLVNRKQDDKNPGAQYADQQADVQLINTYKDIITQRVTLNAVVDKLTKPHREKVGKKDYKLVPAKYSPEEISNDNLASMITVATQQNSQVFSVSVKTANPEMSRDIANTIADVFKEKIVEIMSISNVSVISKAVADPTPVSPNIPLITLVGVLLGVLSGYGWGFIREVSDRTVKEFTFITDELGLTNLGIVNYIHKMKPVHEVLGNVNQNLNSEDTRSGRRI